MPEQQSNPQHARSSAGVGTSIPSLPTQTVTQTIEQPPLVLRLTRTRPDQHPIPSDQQEEEERRIHWNQGVVDNEHANKKKSKKCCIFHKKKGFDESDTESEGEDSSSDGEFFQQHPDAASHTAS